MAHGGPTLVSAGVRAELVEAAALAFESKMGGAFAPVLIAVASSGCRRAARVTPRMIAPGRPCAGKGGHGASLIAWIRPSTWPWDRPPTGERSGRRL